MKKTLVLLSLVFYGFAASAQVRYGITAGPSLDRVVVRNSAPFEDKAEFLTGYFVGGVAKISLGKKANLIPALTVAHRGGRNAVYTEKLRLTYLGLPLLLNVNFTERFGVDVGVDPAYLIGSDYDEHQAGPFTTIEFSKFDFGFTGGLRLMAGDRLMINARYNYGILQIGTNDLRSEINQQLGSVKQYNRNLQLGLSVLL